MADHFLLKALKKKYEGDIYAAKANIQVYIDGAVGIGEHPDVIGAIDELYEKRAEATDKLMLIEEDLSHAEVAE
jgi:hypothetical protein